MAFAYQWYRVDFFFILVTHTWMKAESSLALELRRAGVVLQANLTSWKKMLYSYFVEVELRVVGQLQILKRTDRAGAMKKHPSEKYAELCCCSGHKKAGRMVSLSESPGCIQ